MSTGQKKAPDLITDGCEPPCGCWELNSGPLEEQAMLLTTEPSLQPERKSFLRNVLKKKKKKRKEKEMYLTQEKKNLESPKSAAPAFKHLPL